MVFKVMLFPPAFGPGGGELRGATGAQIATRLRSLGRPPGGFKEPGRLSRPVQSIDPSIRHEV